MREVLHRAASLPALFGVGDEIDDNTQDLLVRVRSEEDSWFVVFLANVWRARCWKRTRDGERLSLKSNGTPISHRCTFLIHSFEKRCHV